MWNFSAHNHPSIFVQQTIDLIDERRRKRTAVLSSQVKYRKYLKIKKNLVFLNLYLSFIKKNTRNESTGTCLICTCVRQNDQTHPIWNVHTCDIPVLDLCYAKTAKKKHKIRIEIPPIEMYIGKKSQRHSTFDSVMLWLIWFRLFLKSTNFPVDANRVIWKLL